MDMFSYILAKNNNNAGSGDSSGSGVKGERLEIDSSLTFTNSSGEQENVIDFVCDNDDTLVQTVIAIKLSTFSENDDGKYSLGQSIFSPNLNLSIDPDEGIVQCLDDITQICIYNYYSSCGDYKITDYLEQLYAGLNASGISSSTYIDVDDYVYMYIVIIGQFASSELSEQVATYINTEVAPLFHSKKIAIYRIPNYENKVVTVNEVTA